jgi:hypothetical protein
LLEFSHDFLLENEFFSTLLSQTPTGSVSVGSDSWLAADFITGTSANGYSLDSIQLGMANASGSPTNFTVMLYSAFIRLYGLLCFGLLFGKKWHEP